MPILLENSKLRIAADLINLQNIFMNFNNFIKVVFYFFKNIISDSPIISTKVHIALYFMLTTYFGGFLISYLYPNDLFEIVISNIIIFVPFVAYILSHVFVDSVVKKVGSLKIKLTKIEFITFYFYLILFLTLSIFAITIMYQSYVPFHLRNK
jgi:hypothetical protein